MIIRSFSGAHSFRPACLKGRLELDAHGATPDEVIDALETLVGEIDMGFCPRCHDAEIAAPAGSRITTCRCVPICSDCGEHEALCGLYSPWDWYADPPDHGKVVEEVAEIRAKSRRVTAVLLSDWKLLTEEGVTEVTPRPHPGGWFEFGDEGDDEEEREG